MVLTFHPDIIGNRIYSLTAEYADVLRRRLTPDNRKRRSLLNYADVFTAASVSCKYERKLIMLTSTLKTIQIDIAQFEDLYVYAARHADPDDPQFKRITIFVKKKLRALMQHELYSLCKAGSTEEARKKVEKKYFEAIDLLEAFQWGIKQGENVPSNGSR